MFFTLQYRNSFKFLSGNATVTLIIQCILAFLAAGLKPPVYKYFYIYIYDLRATLLFLKKKWDLRHTKNCAILQFCLLALTTFFTEIKNYFQNFHKIYHPVTYKYMMLLLYILARDFLLHLQNEVCYSDFTCKQTTHDASCGAW